jgi:hypothetical protein
MENLFPPHPPSIPHGVLVVHSGHLSKHTMCFGDGGVGFAKVQISVALTV